MTALVEWLHLDAMALGLVLVAVVVGAVIQGSIGFGLNMVVAPVVALLEPAALPASLIIMSLPMTLGSALREHDHIDARALVWSTLGRLPGVALGAWVVSAVSPDLLATIIGGLLVVAALISASHTHLRVTPRSLMAAGFASGAMGTASSIGGPPLALVYQSQPGPVIRSTLGAVFAIGIAMSLAALLVAGQVRSWHLWLGLALMPGIGLGLFASRGLHAWLDRGWLRPAVLGFALISGSVVMLRGLL